MRKLHCSLASLDEALFSLIDLIQFKASRYNWENIFTSLARLTCFRNIDYKVKFVIFISFMMHETSFFYYFVPVTGVFADICMINFSTVVLY